MTQMNLLTIIDLGRGLCWTFMDESRPEYINVQHYTCDHARSTISLFTSNIRKANGLLKDMSVRASVEVVVFIM